MNLEKFSEKAYLYSLGELTDEEKIEFENILLEDSQLNEEYLKIKSDLELFEKAKPAEISDPELAVLRNNLFREIRKEAELSQEESLIEKLRNLFFNNYTLAFGGLATFVLGILIGYSLFFSRSEIQKMNNKMVQGENSYFNSKGENNFGTSADLIDNKQTIQNKKSLNKSVKDNSLAAMLIGNYDDGIRIKSVNTISEQVDLPTFKPDVKIKNALVKAMKFDSNPAVRMEALNVLQKFPHDNEIRDAFLQVLSKDKNSGLRVAAINALSDLRFQGMLIGEEIKQVLAKKADAESNKYVKYRAALILKEVE